MQGKRWIKFLVLKNFLRCQMSYDGSDISYTKAEIINSKSPLTSGRKNPSSGSENFLINIALLHFLIERNSKLRKVSSRAPLAVTARVWDDDLGSNPDWSLCEDVRRPLLESNRPERLSLGSPEELGLLLDTTAFLVLLPYREELRPFSGSGC